MKMFSASDNDSRRDRPLFGTRELTPEEHLLRCWATGIPGGCKAIPLEQEGSSSSLYDRRSRLADRTERYVVACAVMREAQEKLGLDETLLAVVMGMVVYELPWDKVAIAAGLDDEKLEADSVYRRARKALAGALRCVREAMEARAYRDQRAEK